MATTMLPLLMAIVALVALELSTRRHGADGRSPLEDAGEW